MAEYFFNVKFLAVGLLVGSLLWADLEQRIPSRVRLSRAVADSLIQFRIHPICPYEACSRCVESEVVLKLVVNKGGTVKNVRVIQPINLRLAEAALDAVKQWRYRSYMQNGRPVEFETLTTIKSWKCEL
jgi:protein TonB